MNAVAKFSTAIHRLTNLANALQTALGPIHACCPIDRRICLDKSPIMGLSFMDSQKGSNQFARFVNSFVRPFVSRFVDVFDS